MINITINSSSGQFLLSAPVNTGAKGYYSLMQHDYITLPFSLQSPVEFGIGSYADLRESFSDALGGKLAKIYKVCDLQTPTYNTATGGYDYTLRLDAYYWLWKNKIFKYTPEAAGQEASWSLTASLDVHLGVFLRNLDALGETYGEKEYEFSIDSTVENKAVAITYDNTNLIDALSQMAEAWNCEWWVTENVIHFGRLENGDAVELETGVNAESMTRNESKGTYATRIYAFGSTRNIPENYRPNNNEDLTVNGVVQKRLMLPADTPYIDARPGLTEQEVVESVVVFDDIYPRRVGTLSDVKTVNRAIEDEDGNQTGTFKAYQYKDTGLAFEEYYTLEGQELRIVFQSGKLNGLDFGVIFNPNDADPAEQLWEIEANEDYGRRLPDEVMKPENGDTYILYGFDIKLVSDQYIPAAEQELKAKAEEYVAKTQVDDGTYTVPLYSSWVKEDEVSHTFDAGQRIRLKNPAYFGTSGRTSRVIGWEMCLDIPYDRPVYTIGESAQYSRLGELEDKVDSLTLNGQAYQGIRGGSGVYLIRTNDSTPASNSNAYSALRSRLEFLAKTRPETMPFLMTFLQGAVFGKDGFASGLTGFGAKMDEYGNGEMENLFIRRSLTVPLLVYNRVDVQMGDKWRAPGVGIIDTVDTENKICTLKLEDGEIGAVKAGDICMGIYHAMNSGDNATEDYDDSRGNRRFAGFCTVYFTITEVMGDRNEQFKYQVRPVSERWTTSFDPFEQMTFVAYGSFTDEDRQSSVYETRTYTRMLWKQNTWEIASANIALQYGDLSNLNVHGMQMTGYSMYLNSVYFTGTIMQTKPDGTPVRTANDRGAWETGHYDYYDRVSHNGCIWLCVNEDGTDSEPAEGNPDWLLQVRKGDDGEPGPQGVPGTDGKDGKTYYTWIRYADDAQGTGISNNPTGKEYIGFAYNKETATESNNPLDYTWSLIKGTDGQPGAKGEDGTQYWTWIAYSDNADGSNMYQVPNEDTKYIGIAVNKLTQTESSDPADYTWSKFKGEDGAGISNLGNWYTGLFVPYLGIVRMGYGSYMCINKNGTSNPPLWTITDKDGNRLLQTQDGGNTYGYILTGEMNTAEYVLVAADGADGVNGVDGIQGPKGEDGRTTYFHVKYSANPDGNPMSETPSVYIGTYVDYTEEDSDDYTKYTWSRFQGLQGEQGIPGKDGASGITYYWHIKYSNDGGATFTANNGETPGKFMGTLVDTNPTDSSTPSAYKWAEIKGDKGDQGDKGDKGDKGEDGTSVSHHGDWKTGKFIPYMGIVRMGGSSWICINANGTSNPPCWTITDSAGNRLLQTQDGGRTYGYILTGENNTAEYDLVAEDGKPGADGKPGDKGKQGLQGCILRRSEWKTGTEYRNDEALTSSTRYLDVALVQDNNAATGWRAYKCRQTHTSSSANAPGTSGGNTYWEEFGINTTAIFTSLIIAKDALINFMSGNQLLIRKDDGTVTIGLTGGYNNKAYIWAGGTTPDNARFRVDELGKAVMTDSEVHGTIYAISGQIGGFTIVGNSLQNTGDGYITITNGKRMAGIGGGLAGILGYDAAGVFRNEEPYSLPAGTVNIAAYLSASGAQYNFAFQGRGNGVLSGIMEGYALNYVDNTSANVTDLTRGKYIEMNTPSGNVAHVLPRKTHVEGVLGVSSTTAFAVLLHYFGKYESGGSFTLYGRTTSVSGANTAEFPYLYDHNGNNVSVQIAKGDSAEVLLVYDGAQYFAQLLNVRN